MNSLFRQSAPLARTFAARNAWQCSKRTIITLHDHKYTAHATATGQGRNGEVTSKDDAPLELKLATPKALGGQGNAHNPEQLFAMGYASCFLGALQFVAGQQGKKDLAKNAVIHTSVHLGKPNGMEGFGLEVDIKVEGVPDEELLKAAHEFCPYSRALTHGVVVNVSKA